MSSQKSGNCDGNCVYTAQYTKEDNPDTCGLKKSLAGEMPQLCSQESALKRAQSCPLKSPGESIPVLQREMGQRSQRMPHQGCVRARAASQDISAEPGLPRVKDVEEVPGGDPLGWLPLSEG